MQFVFSEILEKILRKEDLNSEESGWLMEQTMDGNLTSAQIAAWLVAMRCKGETSGEISTFASVMRDHAVQIQGITEPVLDTCGTGGDKSSLLNVSTLAAIVLANRGVRIAKHGNRSVSSSSGTADIFERMGYPLSRSPEEIVQGINQKNFGFFFAPAFHPAMKYAGPVRKEMGVRSVFNVLGPLTNPAHAAIHLLGVFSKEYLKIMAEALARIGVKTFMVVHSVDGLDEISPVAKTDYAFFHEGIFQYGSIDPKPCNFAIKSLNQVVVKNADEAFSRVVSVLSGKDISGAEIVAINAAAAQYLWDTYHKKTTVDLPSYIKEKTGEIKYDPGRQVFISKYNLMSEKLLSNIIENSPIGYCLVSADLNLKYINPKLLEYLALTSDQLLDKKWISLLVEKNYLHDRKKSFVRWLAIKFCTIDSKPSSKKFITKITGNSNIEYCVEINPVQMETLRLITVYPVSGTIALYHNRMTRTLNSEYKIASKIQRNINDFIIDMIEGRFFRYHFKRLFMPSSLLSGDIVNIKTVSRRYSSIFIGDGRGHGIPAALFSALIHSYLNITASEVTHGIADTALLVNNVNKYAFRDFSGTGEFYFFSGVYGLIDGNTRNFSITNAGHPYPVFIRENKIQRLESNGPILGIGADSRYEKIDIELMDGDTFIFFTDGLYDILNGEADSDHDGLTTIFQSFISENKSGAPDILKLIENSIQDFTSRSEYVDDITVLQMTVEEKR
ncbi:MAG: anthranilate phosphoribosyltransferase [Spirochaetia bacterium]|nr:anthranilate phosphoribosyltransferase [Spirochaetia bacterium]